MFFSSAAPINELRGSLLVALRLSDIPWYFAFPVCFAGNLLPVPFLLLLLNPIAELARKVKPLGLIIDWVFNHTRRRGRLVEKYERIGLILVVAVPLPGSGAWTGSILAFLLGLEFKSSLISIVIGVFIAGVIVTILSLLGWVGAVVAGIGLVSAAALGNWRT